MTRENHSEPTWEIEPRRSGLGMYLFVMMLPYVFVLLSGSYALMDSQVELSAFVVAMSFALIAWVFVVFVLGMALGYVKGPTLGLFGQRDRTRMHDD